MARTRYGTDRGLSARMVGTMFGLGLLVSGMTSPDRVIGFLDVAGNWNPNLAFVMGTGLLVAAPLFWIANRRGTALSGDALAVEGCVLFICQKQVWRSAAALSAALR